MANPLAPTTFNAGPKDSLATLDVYVSDGAKVINSIQALSAKAGIDLAGIFGTKIPTSLGGILKAVGGAVQVDTKALTARLVQNNQSLQNAFKGLSSDAQGSITGSYFDSGTVLATVGSVQSTVASGNITDVRSLSSFMNTYTSSLAATTNSPYSVQDEDGVACVMAGVIGEGSTLGVQGIYTQLSSNITSTTLLSKVVDQSVPQLLQNSDITTLHDMSSAAGAVMGALFPNFCSNLVQTYTSTLAGFERNPAQAFNQLVGTLNNVKATWYAFERNPGATALNLLGLAGASPDLLNIVSIGASLLESNDTKRFMALGSIYPATTLAASIKKFFPRTYISTNLKQDPKTVTLSPAVNQLLGNVITGVVTGLNQNQ